MIHGSENAPALKSIGARAGPSLRALLAYLDANSDVAAAASGRP